MRTLSLALAVLPGCLLPAVAVDAADRHGGPWGISYPVSPPTQVNEPPHAPPSSSWEPAVSHEPTYNPPPQASYHHTESHDHVKTYEIKTYSAPPYTKSYKPHPTPTPQPPPPPPPPPSPPSLEDALIKAGCAKFLQFIKSDNDTWALYSSSLVQTVFAPDDVSFDSHAARRRDLTPAQQKQASLAAESKLTDMAALRLVPGSVVETNDKSANLGGAPQVVVSQPNNAGGASVSSGLGEKVDVKTGDVPYSGGLIHVTTGLFTPPQPLSLTANALSDTSIFAGLLTSLQAGNLTRRQTESLDSTPRITVFIPSDAAFRSAGAVPKNNVAQLLAGHVVVSNGLADPVGYLPELTDGKVLTTKNGQSLSVRAADGQYYIGPAKIERPNLILPNGVAHIVDKVLTQPPIQTAGAIPGVPAGAGRAAFAAAGAVAAALFA